MTQRREVAVGELATPVVDLSDEALRRRALLHARRRKGSTSEPRNPDLPKLLAAIDALQEEPTEEEMRRLAWEYHETYTVVLTAVEFRLKKLWRRRVHSGGTKWLPEEETVLRALWEARGDEPLVSFDARVTEILNGLPANKRRQVVRTQGSVTRYRKDHRMLAGFQDAMGEQGGGNGDGRLGEPAQ